MSYIKGKISPRPGNKRNGKSRKSRKDARVTLYPVPAVTHTSYATATFPVANRAANPTDI